jgi:hypothetical protein
MEGLVKIGPWGGRGGDPRDDIVAAGVAPHRLESIVIRCQGAVDAISFTYAGVDGVMRKAGPWGGSGGRKHKVRTRSTYTSCSSFAHRHDSRRMHLVSNFSFFNFLMMASRSSSARGRSSRRSPGLSVRSAATPS